MAGVMTLVACQRHVADESASATRPVMAAAGNAGPTANVMAAEPVPVESEEAKAKRERIAANIANSTANLNPDDDEIVAPPQVIADCDSKLNAAGVKFHATSMPVTHQKGGFDCGAPQVIVYDRGPTGVTWGGAIVSCGLALGMARFEAIVQDEAQRTFNAKVTRMENGGTYSCRKMARFKMVSEHSYANAIDVRSFELANGKRIVVERDFGAPARPPETDGARFLRASGRRAFDENVFSVVLTPHFDELHRDHFHLDQSRYRTDGSR